MAFVVVGFQVMTPERDGKGVSKRPKKISIVFETRGGAEAYAELARKGPYPEAFVHDVMKHDDIN